MNSEASNENLLDNVTIPTLEHYTQKKLAQLIPPKDEAAVSVKLVAK